MKERYFNINTQYLKVLINNKDREEISKKLKISVVALNLKLKGSTLLYIHEGIQIAKYLKMDILDIFCPDKDILVKYLVGGDIDIKPSKIKYGEFLINTDHIKNMMKAKEITNEQIAYIWNLKITSVYDKLRGSTKITLKEGISLSFLLDESVDKIFCPNLNDIIHSNVDVTDVLGFSDLAKSSKKPEAICMKSLESFKFSKRMFNLHRFNSSMKENNLTVEDIAKLWNVSANQVRYKIRNKKINFNQGLKLANLLKCKMEHLFIIKDDSMKNQIYMVGRKLNESQVRDIRKALTNNNKSYKELAEKYNVKPITIRKIDKGQTWKHVK